MTKYQMPNTKVIAARASACRLLTQAASLRYGRLAICVTAGAAQLESCGYGGNGDVVLLKTAVED